MKSFFKKLRPHSRSRIWITLLFFTSLFNYTPVGGQTMSAKDEISQSFEDGLKYFSDSKFKEAITSYDRVIELADTMKSAWYNRAICKLILYDFEGSKIDFSKVLSLDTSSIKAMKYLGFIEMRLKNNLSAEELFSQALEIDPMDKVPLLNRSILFIKNNELDAALYGFNKALEIDPNFDQAYFNRGIVRTKKEDHQGAIIDYSIAIRLSPKTMKYYLNRANAYVRTGDYLNAVKDYNLVISREPNNINAINSREYAQSFIDDPDPTTAKKDIPFNFNSKDWEGFKNQAFEKVKSGKSKEGLADLLLIEKVFANDPEYKVMLENASKAPVEVKK
ncbi:MAG: tetratricopeptide repeat protein [Saprospiraceae bacterium]